MKQLLVSLCKSCLQGGQSVETIIRIFGELQVIGLFIRRFSTCFYRLGNCYFSSEYWRSAS